ncbi:hypothetical protein [Aliarcobacter cibarius]|uniref:Uncharacterized protein n=1 Tax=Aliarcobacter cibarius TaxID=255507 RepID=A0ABY2V4V2_9BACT|nr:hypothetical protein [Aliarcobacter cibarius]TLS99581.1 hypothetical protein FE247_05730 [Aliarcobacter cibarius]TLT00018.1 hypothetical protein FE245_06005 [Aliarcobacter cibarius]
MSLEDALKFAKNVGADKVPFRFQFPVDIKEEFEVLCDKHNVSMTDMILGLIKSAIDEDKGLTNVSVVNIINKLEELEKQYASLYKVYEDTGDDIIECTDGSVYHISDNMDKLRFRIKVLNKELERRTLK